jgi:hypothetical protein
VSGRRDDRERPQPAITVCWAAWTPVAGDHGGVIGRDPETSRNIAAGRQAGSARKSWRTELIVALVAALAGGLISIAGSLAGVYWQTRDGEHHMQQSMRHAAVDKFIDEYSIVKVELQHYGDMRIPATAISLDDQAAMRKHVHGVEGACARLVLVAPELVAPATNFRNVLIDWGHAISEPLPYGRQHHDSYIQQYDAAQATFLSEAKAALELA